MAIEPLGRFEFRRLVPALVLVIACPVVAACGDDEGPAASGPAPTSTIAATAPAAPSAASSGSAAPSAVPSSTQAGPNPYARNPAYYTYEASDGDTLASVAAIVNGQPGSAKAGLPQQIRDLNTLTSDTLTEGQLLIVPLISRPEQPLLPDASIRTAIGSGAAGGALQLLAPGTTLNDGYRGRLVLAALKVHDGNPATEGAGYLMRFSQTDRPFVKGGTQDPEAVVVDDAFTVAGGSLVPELERRAQASGATTARVTRDGIDYLVAAGATSEVRPEQIVALLAPSP